MVFAALINFAKRLFRPRTDAQRTGDWAEQAAATHLRSRGYRILRRNWRAGQDELDLIALDNSQIVFVEVRARIASARVPGAASLSGRKRIALRRAATAYLRKQQPASWRFDIIEVSYTSRKDYSLQHYQGVRM